MAMLHNWKYRALHAYKNPRERVRPVAYDLNRKPQNFWHCGKRLIKQGWFNWAAW